jgi:hypothetical protein
VGPVTEQGSRSIADPQLEKEEDRVGLDKERMKHS